MVQILRRCSQCVLGPLVLAVAACSSAPGPIVDTKGVDMAKYHADLADCKTYADQVRMERGVAKGAAGGAAVGAAVGAITDNDVGEYAGVGAVAGGAKSAVRADREKSQVVKNCMRYRGYRVLN